MEEEELASRLSQISTAWTLVRQAHGGTVGGEPKAREQLMERYHRAAYRYLLAALRDPDAAAEAFQDFALRFLRGDFRRADPGKGKFRQYLKTALSHLITDHYRRKKRSPVQLASEHVDAIAAEDERENLDLDFAKSWREELLARTWEALHEVQAEGGAPLYDVLRLRAEHPGMTSGTLAAALNDALNPSRPFTNTGVRKSLQRARERFAELLLEEVRASLDPSPGVASPEAIENELIDLDLLAYCRPILKRRGGGSREGP